MIFELGAQVQIMLQRHSPPAGRLFDGRRALNGSDFSVWITNHSITFHLLYTTAHYFSRNTSVL